MPFVAIGAAIPVPKDASPERPACRAFVTNARQDLKSVTKSPLLSRALACDKAGHGDKDGGEDHER